MICEYKLIAKFKMVNASAVGRRRNSGVCILKIAAKPGLRALAGDTHQSPAERVMLERWIEGVKGDL